MTVATALVESRGLPMVAAAPAATPHGGIEAAGFAGRAASLLGDGLMVLLLAYVIGLAMVAVCLPFALLFAVLRWLGS
jgi:hypothetical protein